VGAYIGGLLFVSVIIPKKKFLPESSEEYDCGEFDIGKIKDVYRDFHKQHPLTYDECFSPETIVKLYRKYGNQKQSYVEFLKEITINSKIK